jgi:AmiR/NasT family two-component response regulator
MSDQGEILLVEDNPNDIELILAALSKSEVIGEVKLKRIPVVMLTSSREERDLLRSYDIGTNAYVVKPISYQAFVEVIKEIGLFWGVINQAPSMVEPKS